MTDGREDFIKQTISIRKGRQSEEIKNPLLRKSDLLKEVKTTLHIPYLKNSALSLKKPYPSKENILPATSCTARKLHSIYFLQSEVCAKQETDIFLVKNRGEKKIAITYPPIYICRETLCNFIRPYNTIFY
jgi:hypothetical protein